MARDSVHRQPNSSRTVESRIVHGTVHGCRSMSISQYKQTGYAPPSGFVADSKLAVSWLVSDRDSEASYALMDDLASWVLFWHRSRVMGWACTGTRSSTRSGSTGLRAVREAVPERRWRRGGDPDDGPPVQPGEVYGRSPAARNRQPGPGTSRRATSDAQPLHAARGMRGFARLTSAASKLYGNHQLLRSVVRLLSFGCRGAIPPRP